MAKLEKRVGERRTYDMDFSLEPEMIEGEVIVSVDSVTADPADLVIGPPTHNTTRAQATIEGGIAGTTYKVIWTITTDEGSILVGNGQLKVIAD
jgi:hypothetical protein